MNQGTRILLRACWPSLRERDLPPVDRKCASNRNGKVALSGESTKCSRTLETGEGQMSANGLNCTPCREKRPHLNLSVLVATEQKPTKGTGGLDRGMEAAKQKQAPAQTAGFHFSWRTVFYSSMLRRSLCVFLLVTTSVLAQTGKYEDARYLGFQPVTNGSVCDPIVGCGDRHVTGYLVDVAGTRYTVAKPSDAEAPVVMPSPFSHRQVDLLASIRPGTTISIRVTDRKLFVLDTAKGKERPYWILAAGPSPK